MSAVPSLDPLDEALAAGAAHLLALQRPDGCWEGEMVWSPMINAWYVLAATIIGVELPEDRRKGLIRSMFGDQHADGTWALHDEGDPSLFVTTMVYVALRHLGVSPDAPELVRARSWIQGEGGVGTIPTWGRVWLGMLGLYGWEGVPPMPAEIWLVPSDLPGHPSQWYCHTRLTYLCMSVIRTTMYTVRSPIASALARELYPVDPARIDFRALRGKVREAELHAPPTLPLRAAYAGAGLLEGFVPSALTRRAVARCLALVRVERTESRGACISPVSGLLGVLALAAGGAPAAEVRRAFDDLERWVWIEDGAHRLVGARSNAWDTGFVVQAFAELPGGGDAASLERALAWLDANQELEPHPDARGAFRDPREGGWCFSDVHHRWPVSDCTAEALVALRDIERRLGRNLSTERLDLAARFILHRANPDGGFGSYEAGRGPSWLDSVNPSELYGACMTERSYIECTASCIRGLVAWRRLRPSAPAELASRVEAAIAAAVGFLRAAQREDGSWPGAWGIHYTYGTFFAVHGLSDAGVGPDDPVMVKARAWLRGARLADGGWGETWQSAAKGPYEAAEASHSVQTAWGLLAALYAGERHREHLAPAVDHLLARQEADGGWAPEAVEGVFFETAALRYRYYRLYFPLHALARYRAVERAGALI